MKNRTLTVKSRVVGSSHGVGGHALYLTERDRGVLRYLAQARWLSTRQVRALSFPGVSHSMACRRLRLLRRARYVRSVRENSMMEALHTLGVRGREALRDFGYERRIPQERHPPVNRRHFLGVNDIRIAVLRSVARDGVALNFFFASWELQERIWPYGMVPDAVCAVEREGKTATAIFEYDRATEGVPYVVDRKFRRYAEGLDGFGFSHVITIVESSARREQLAACTRAKIADARFSFLMREELSSWSAERLLKEGGSRGGSGDGSHV